MDKDDWFAFTIIALVIAAFVMAAFTAGGMFARDRTVYFKTVYGTIHPHYEVNMDRARGEDRRLFMSEDFTAAWEFYEKARMVTR